MGRIIVENPFYICMEKDNYRFGFNGQEKVNEIAGIGNHNTAPDKFQQGEVLIPGMVTGARSVAAPSTKGQ